MPWPRAKEKGRDSGVERFWQMQSKISQIVDEAPMGQLIREKSPGLSRQPSAITGLVQNGTSCSIDMGSWRKILGDSRGEALGCRHGWEGCPGRSCEGCGQRNRNRPVQRQNRAPEWMCAAATARSLLRPQSFARLRWLVGTSARRRGNKKTGSSPFVPERNHWYGNRQLPR